MKTVFIIDHMSANNLAAPSQRQMRKLGHNLFELLGEMRRIGVAMEECPLTYFCDGTIGHDILAVLDNFARVSRYHNLDNLASPSPPIDPLNEWESVLSRVFKENVPERQRKKIEFETSKIAAATKGLVTIYGHDLKGKVSTHESAFLDPRVQDASAGYAVFHVIRLIAAIRDILDYVTLEAGKVEHDLGSPASVPYMKEFLDWLWLERKYVIRKRRWPKLS